MSKKLWDWGGQITQTLRLCNQHTKRYELQKLFLLHHRRIESAMEIRQIPCKPHRGTIVALMQTTYEQEAVGMGRPKTQTLRLCNQHTKRYELPKLFLLHHRRIESAMEIRLNLLQTLPRNNSCTNANYI